MDFDLKEFPYFKVVDKYEGGYVYSGDKKLLMLGSNDYLGLSLNSEVIKAASSALRKFGTSCSGSRFLNGNLVLHEELEKKLAKLYNKEKAIIFNSGYSTNLGVISSILNKEDIVLCDKESHASIVDGVKFAQARLIRYEHGNYAHLEFLNKKYSSKLIVSDSVFSMSGEVADLNKIIQIKNNSNLVMIDEAHGLGIFGEKGLGVSEQQNCINDLDIIMGTFSKSLGGMGGFVVGKSSLIEYIKFNSNPFIFTAALPPTLVACILKSLDILINMQKERDYLLNLVKYMRTSLASIGYEVGGSSPIIPIYVNEESKAFKLALLLFKKGVWVHPIVYPGVPKNKAILRTSYTVLHTYEDINFALNIFDELKRYF